MKIVSVYGTKKSGKTTVVTSLIRALTRRGHRVASLKYMERADRIDIASKRPTFTGEQGRRVQLRQRGERPLFYEQRREGYRLTCSSVALRGQLRSRMVKGKGRGS